ncbi:MAG: ribonuclease HII [Candidatus Heimdallarchaeota archaeon]|nr:ribonuclease HII [Candidatus Heimdallarchaeota archaeon]
MSNDKSIIIAGMDEAGRGPAIGPIVFGLVLVTKEQETLLKEKGVKDSKALTLKQREQYKKVIEETVFEFATLQLSAAEIDDQRAHGINLNQIEVIAFKNLLKPYVDKIDELQLDAADVNEQRFGNNFKDIFNGKIISKHKGDSLYISVGAASILAKVQRDHEIIRLQENMNQFDPTLPSFGSGYPMDAKPFLTAYVSKYKELPEIARKSWKTCSNILREELDPKQTSLDW